MLNRGPRCANSKNTKLGHKGALPGSRDEFLNFGTFLISLERMKIQTSNFACGLTLRDTEPKSRDLLALRCPTGGGVKLPPGRFHPRIFGTKKYTTVCVYDFF